MIYVIQIIKMLTKQQRSLFIAIFNDLSYDIEELDYDGIEGELINDLLLSHFGFDLMDECQLEILTAYIMRHQGNLKESIKGIEMTLGMKVA